MVTKEEFDKLNTKIRAEGLVMSSVPKPARDEFVQFAEEEFANNYGACLKYVWDHFKLSMTFLQNYDTKLNYIIELLEKGGKINKKEIKLLSGKSLKGGSIKNE